MSIFGYIRLAMRAISLWKRGESVYQKSEMIKEKVEQVQRTAENIYKKAGSPSSSEIGATLGRGAGNAFLKLKKLTASRKSH